MNGASADKKEVHADTNCNLLFGQQVLAKNGCKVTKKGHQYYKITNTKFNPLQFFLLVQIRAVQTMAHGSNVASQLVFMMFRIVAQTQC